LPGRVDKRLKEILYQIADELSCEILELEGRPDHLHILCEVDPPFGVHKFVKRVKRLALLGFVKSFPA
jgi:putative transposase